MKKYLKIMDGVMVLTKDHITKGDLLEVRDLHAMLIDLERGEYFDADKNKWLPVNSI